VGFYGTGSATFTATFTSALYPSPSAHPASVPVSASSTPTAAITTPSSPSTPTPAPAPKKKKSNTVAIAVGVVVPVVVIAFGLLAFFFLRHRKSRKANGPAELGGEGVKQQEMAYEVDAHYKAEMPSNALAYELGGKELKAEQLNTGK